MTETTNAETTSAPATEDVLAAAPVALDGGLFLYPVLSPLRYGGKLYSPDDPEANVIALAPDEAEALQAIGVLGEAVTDGDVVAAFVAPKAKRKK